MSVVIFSGPPCTGKSTIAARVARKIGATHLEMDSIRLRLIPETHTREARQIAYRAIHLIAEHLLTFAHAVVLDATYGPFRSRRDLVEVVVRTGVDAHLIQCSLEPHRAVERFRARCQSGEIHPAPDLDDDRVLELAARFPFANTGLRLDTSTKVEDAVQTVLDHLNVSNRFEADEWIRDPGGQPI